MTGHSEPKTYPLSREQEAIWLNDAIAEGRSRYTVLWARRLRGDVDPDAVEWALDQVTRRHESLRSRYAMEAEGLVQVVCPEALQPLVRVECPEAELDERLRELAARPLDPADGPLRPTLLRVADGHWVIAVLMHHLVMDDWSLAVLDREFAHFYRTHVRREDECEPAEAALPALALQAGPYAAEQRAHDIPEEQLRYWHERLTGLPKASTVPPDFPRPKELGDGGGRVELGLPAELAESVRRLARACRSTPFTVLASAVAALLHRHNGQSDTVLGTAVSRRGGAGLDSLMSCLSDVMPLRLDTRPEVSFRDLVGTVKQEVLGTMRHRDVPFGRLVRDTTTGEDLSRFPLFQTVVTVNDEPAVALDLPGATVERLHVHPGTSKFDLCFDFAVDDGAFRGFLDYSTDLYADATAERIAERFRVLLDAAVTDPDRPLDELPLLSADETALVTGIWAQASDAARTAPLVHDAFENQRRATPEAIAAVWRDQELTYEELGRRADRLGRVLRRSGKPGQAVGILMERSLDMAVAVLAVLKSGAPYVPLDPSYPADRLTYMIHDSGLHTLLTQPSLRDRCAVPDSVKTLEPQDWDLPQQSEEIAADCPPVGPDDLAYLMYTSGSTGLPKGVAMPHGPVAGMVDWQCRDSAAGPGDRTLQFSALSFDASFLEFFCTWSTGGTLVIIDAEVRTDYDALLEVIAKQRVKRIFLPFVALQSIAFYATAMGLPTPALKECITAGEQLHVTPAIREFFAGLDDAVLFNQYGPTETHSVSSLRLDGDPAKWPLMPTIGYPINGARVYILDDRFRVQPAGVAGELCVAGRPVSQGYWQRPELTREKFMPSPLGEADGTLYRTGDVARYLPNGQIEFFGRRDGMVKIRGYRVEIGEIEALLGEQPGIADAVVIAHTSGVGDTRLIAHYRPSEQPGPDAATLQKTLADRLPEYMLPSAYVLTEHEFPRTPSGKVDRLALSRTAPGAR